MKICNGHMHVDACGSVFSIAVGSTDTLTCRTSRPAATSDWLSVHQTFACATTDRASDQATGQSPDLLRCAADRPMVSSTDSGSCGGNLPCADPAWGVWCVSCRWGGAPQERRPLRRPAPRAPAACGSSATIRRTSATMRGCVPRLVAPAGPQQASVMVGGRAVRRAVAARHRPLSACVPRCFPRAPRCGTWALRPEVARRVFGVGGSPAAADVAAVFGAGWLLLYSLHAGSLCGSRRPRRR